LSDLACERIAEALYARHAPSGAFLSQADLVAVQAHFAAAFQRHIGMFQAQRSRRCAQALS
jgi:hypothetical protein